MRYAAVHCAWLAQVAPTVDDAALGAWLRLYTYCARLELGETPDASKESPIGEARIQGSGSWDSRAWLRSADVDEAGVSAVVSAGLAYWDGDDLMLRGYDMHGQAVVEKRRDSGKNGGRPRKNHVDNHMDNHAETICQSESKPLSSPLLSSPSLPPSPPAGGEWTGPYDPVRRSEILEALWAPWGKGHPEPSSPRQADLLAKKAWEWSQGLSEPERQRRFVRLRKNLTSDQFAVRDKVRALLSGDWDTLTLSPQQAQAAQNGWDHGGGSDETEEGRLRALQGDLMQELEYESDLTKRKELDDRIRAIVAERRNLSRAKVKEAS